MVSFDSNRRKVIKLIGISSSAMVMPGLFFGCGDSVKAAASLEAVDALSIPKYEGMLSLEQALYLRHSEREYAQTAMTFEQVSQLMWAAQGLNAPRNVSGSPAIGRTTPSAGALYPIELYVFVRNVEGLNPGMYRYEVDQHALTTLQEKDQSEALYNVGNASSSVLSAAATVVISGVIERVSSKYGSRAEQYVAIEVGCVAQSIHLQSAALGLGTVFTGSFSDSGVKSVLDDSENDITPFGIMPIGVLKA